MINATEEEDGKAERGCESRGVLLADAIEGEN